jgi:general stress protein 26
MKKIDTNDPAQIADVVLQHIADHKHFSLGTVDGQGRPWVVYIQLTVDAGLDILWVSLADTEHSKHVRQRPDVAICIASETLERGDFIFYGYAAAHEVTDRAELERLLNLRFERWGKPVPPVSDFLEPRPERLYRAVISEAWINDDSHIKTKVDLDVLRERAASHPDYIS